MPSYLCLRPLSRFTRLFNVEALFEGEPAQGRAKIRSHRLPGVGLTLSGRTSNFGLHVRA